MKYKNTRTGVVVDSPTLVSGGNWVPYEPGQETVKVVEEPVKEEMVEEVEEPEDDVDGLTKAQIIQELESLGKEFNPRDKKEVLLNIMMED